MRLVLFYQRTRVHERIPNGHPRESSETSPSVEVENRPKTGSSMSAAILDPPSWILVMFQLKIISF